MCWYPRKRRGKSALGEVPLHGERVWYQHNLDTYSNVLGSSDRYAQILLLFDVALLYWRLPCDSSTAAIWNHWELDVHISWNSIICSLVSAVEVAWPKRNTSRSAILLDIMLSARRGCPEATVWNHWELDVHMSWSSILFNLLRALDVVWPKGNKCRSVLLLSIMLSARRWMSSGHNLEPLGTWCAYELKQYSIQLIACIIGCLI